MKTVALVCAGIALVTSIVAVNSWWELQKMREANAALQKQPVEVSHPGLPAAATPDTALPVTVAAAAPPETPISKTEPSTLTPAMDPQCKSQNVFEARKQLFQDPEYRKRYLEIARTTLKRDHRDLAQELGLSESEAERLFDLLADGQVTKGTEGAFPGGDIDQKTREEALRKSQELDRRQEESIQALLGEKYAQWQAYNSAYSIAGSVSLLLSQAGKPLPALQNRALRTALMSGQQPQAKDPRLFSANQAEQAQAREESNRRTLESVAPHLNADQLAALREQMERSAAIGRTMQRLNNQPPQQ